MPQFHSDAQILENTHLRFVGGFSEQPIFPVFVRLMFKLLHVVRMAGFGKPVDEF